MVVYVAEAHARDEWPVGESVSFCDAPKTLAERVALLQEFARSRVGRVLSEWPLGSVLVDSPEAGDPFLEAFHCWPVRFFALQEANEGDSEGDAFKVALKGAPDAVECSYRMEDLEAWLEANLVNKA